MHSATSKFCAFISNFAIAITAFPLAAAQGITERVSINARGAQGNANSEIDGTPSISTDGRFISFVSYATNLVPGDTNDTIDVFVRDRKLGKTERVNVGPGGAQGNVGSISSAISSDGRFVAFVSSDTNLVLGDTNGVRDIFVRDRKLGKTERVSVGSNGIQANSDSDGVAISADGRFVTFGSSASNLVPGFNPGQVFVHDRKTSTTELISFGDRSIPANDASVVGTISADGRFVSFASYATNLVKGDTNDTRDIFVRDRKLGKTERVSVGPNGIQANLNSIIGLISEDGRFVVFDSYATNLVPHDNNDTRDIFVRDRKTDTTERVNIGLHGIQANDGSDWATISANGRFVAFNSYATNLVVGGTNGHNQVFIRDRMMGRTRLVSMGPKNVQANIDISGSRISADGHFVAFSSRATNLVLRDTNKSSDVFIRILVP